jgi:hypothetical protein
MSLFVNQVAYTYNCGKLGRIRRWRCKHGIRTDWVRAFGVRLKFCHHSNWDDQIVKEVTKGYEMKGMKMCPRNYYVDGFRTKKS